MKSAERPYSRTRIHSGFRIAFFQAVLVMVSVARGVPASEPDDNARISQAGSGKTIRVNVEEVRIDAVVLDGNRRQIPDMNADEFEIYQDGVLQEINACTYIREQETPPGTGPASSSEYGAAPQVSTPLPTRESVGRIIAFVVDNLGMFPEQVYFARMALHKFVETQMQPDDLVSIFQTKGQGARSMVFSSDKQYLRALIDDIRWPHEPGNSPLPQYASAFYAIRAMQDMPGRKHLLLISAQTMLPSPLAASVGPDLVVVDVASILAGFNPLADAALRAGVVIHTLDIRGLEGPGAWDPDFGADRGFQYSQEDLESGGWIQESNVKLHNAAMDRYTQTPVPLSEKTGGLFLRNFNWFVDGIGDTDEYLKGYYLLTYTPPPDTFESDKRDLYHRITVKSKRRGSDVHYRDGFFGTTETPTGPAEKGDTLMQAMFSPFRYNDLAVDLTAGYVDNPREGYLVRAWVHLDGRQLGVVSEKDGHSFISLEALAATTDMNGVLRDSGDTPCRIPVKNEEILWIREHGLRLSIAIPAKAPGNYYVRIAVKDEGSGKIGSAYQYVEIPDLEKGRLALSDLFAVSRAEDVQWVLSDAVEDSGSGPGTTQLDESASPAVRVYQPGESFEYMVVIYNPIAGADSLPELETQEILYRDGLEIFGSEPEALNLKAGSDFKRIPIKKRLRLGKTIQPGHYVLQLQVRDRRAKRDSTAAEALDFEIIPEREPSNLEKAEEWIRKGKEADRDGREAEALQAFGEAAALYRRELDRNSGDAVLWKQTGFVSFLAGHKDNAIAAYEESLRSQPDDAESHHMLGIIHMPDDKIAAIREFREAVRLNPDEAKYRYDLGRALFQTREYSNLLASIGEFQEAVRLDPENGENHASLGIALQGMGRLEEAVGEYQTALTLDLLQENADRVRQSLKDILSTEKGGPGNLLSAGENEDKAKRREYYTLKVKEWRSAIERHVPGRPDEAAVEVGSWPENDLSILFLLIDKIRKGKLQPYVPGSVLDAFDGREYIRQKIIPLLQIPEDSNPMLKRAALLHADIAMLQLDTGYSINEALSDSGRNAGRYGAMESQDGRMEGRPKRLHWAYARTLLQNIYPDPSKNEFVRQWYIAACAFMLDDGRLDYAQDTLFYALELYPSDPRILFYNGILHENFAGPYMQNGLRPDGSTFFPYNTEKSQLKEARNIFKRTLDADPGFAEARLHLGRVTGLLGDHEDAIEELQKAASAVMDPQLRYYRALFLGNELAALNRGEEARSQFELASNLYPNSQAPLLSLSRLAYAGGDYEKAFIYEERVFSSIPDDSKCRDPWWDYDISAVRDVFSLVSEMYKAVSDTGHESLSQDKHKGNPRAARIDE